MVDRSPLSWWPLTAVAGLLVLASVAAANSSLRFSPVERPVEDVPGLPEYQPPTGTPSFPSQPSEVAAAQQSRIPDWLVTAAVALGVLAVAVVIGLLLWTLIRDLLRRRAGRMPADRPRRTSGQTTAEVVAALDAGLVDLSDSDADPRRAVIACWVRLEQAAAVAGIARRAGDTPTDLVTRLLTGGAEGRSAIVSADVLAALAHVYREARYGTHTVDDAMRAQAGAALRRLRAELTVRAGAGAASAGRDGTVSR